MNNIVLINKEAGMTSFDVVSKVRRALQIKKVGHTGTLDPNATGLLVIVLNKATKLVNYLQYDNKEYIFEIELGLMTSTLDIWGDVIEKQDYIYPSEEKVREVLDNFLGKQKQIPPMYSALKKDGKRLYELARENIEVKREARDIEIFDIKLLTYKPRLKIKVSVSSGTYIRSLSADIAKQLGTIGVMYSLVRTKVGSFKLEDANSLLELENRNINYISFEEALDNYPKVDYEIASDIFNGKKIKLDTKEDLVVVRVDNNSVAFYEREKDNMFRCKRGLW